MGALKKITTASFNSTSYQVTSVPTGKASSCDPIDITSLADENYKYAPGLKKYDEIKMTVLGTVSVEAGTKGTLSISGTTYEGQTEGTLSISISNVILTKVEPGEVTVDGDRKITTDLTFQPDGTTGTSPSQS